MNYGLYLSAAGTITSMHRQDVMANNLANVNTVGFKSDELNFRARLPERLESDHSSSLINPQLLLEQLGGGTFAEPTQISFRQADLSRTGNDLDLALQGDGFFVVSSGKAGSAADSVRFTRDGRFTRNSAGDLVLSTNGRPVLDVNNKPIRLNATGKVQIDGAGNVLQDGQAVARLQIATVADKSRMMKEGSNLMKAAAGAAGRVSPSTATVKQGFLEDSDVDAILAMNRMINASKSVQANATMMQYHDNIIGQAVNTMGRVS